MKVNDLIVELKAEIKELEIDVGRLDKKTHELKAENERLRNELKRMAETVIGTNDALIDAHDKNARLHAELAKWRPSWDDAPEWAERIIFGGVYWDGKSQRETILVEMTELRPKVTP